MVERQFTFLGNPEYEKAEFRIIHNEDDIGHYYRTDMMTDRGWSEQDKIYGDEEKFKQYMKEWETTNEEWGI